jgi:hypothetical protein
MPWMSSRVVWLFDQCGDLLFEAGDLGVELLEPVQAAAGDLDADAGQAAQQLAGGEQVPGVGQLRQGALVAGPQDGQVDVHAVADAGAFADELAAVVGELLQVIGQAGQAAHRG